MYKKVVTYTDFSGAPVSEEFHFHMMESDFVDLDFEYERYGGLRNYLKKLVMDIQKNGDDAPKAPMYKFLKELITISVGKKIGNRFDRSEEVRNEFFQTGAYSAFITGLLADPEGIPAFVDGITPNVPEDKKKETLAELRKEGLEIPDNI